MKICVALCNAIWKPFAKNEENVFFHFYFVIIFFLFQTLSWNFVWSFEVLFRSLVQKIKKTHPWNSDLCKLKKTPRNLWDAYIPASLKRLKQTQLTQTLLSRTLLRQTLFRWALLRHTLLRRTFFKADTVKAGSVDADSVKADSVKANTAKAGSVEADSVKVGLC